MGTGYIFHDDGSVDYVNGDYIYRSDGSVDYVNENYVHHSDGSIDYIDGDYIHRADGSIDYHSGNYIYRADGSIDSLHGDFSSNSESDGYGTGSHTSSDSYSCDSDGTFLLVLFFGISFMLILAMILSGIKRANREKKINYEIYQVTQDCEVREPLPGIVCRSNLYHLKAGSYIVKYGERFCMEKDNDVIYIQLDDEIIHGLQYCGNITKYEYLHKNWQSILKLE